MLNFKDIMYRTLLVEIYVGANTALYDITLNIVNMCTCVILHMY